MSDTLDIIALLEPISPESPAGDARAYSRVIRNDIQELRREERREDFDEETRPAQLKKADWAGVVRVAGDALKEQTKDLRVACHLIEGLSHTEGFAGLGDGLEILGRLVAECWDRLNPPIEDGDLDDRATPLANLLDDPNRGVCFPNLIRSLPLMGGDGNRYGLADWLRLRHSHDGDTDKAISETINATTDEWLNTVSQDIARCMKLLGELVSQLDEKMGEASPGLIHLSTAIGECQAFVQEELSRRTPARVGVPLEETSDANTNSKSVADVVSTREQAYADLTRAAEVLEKLEPQSPIPYLVKRAVRLGHLPFPELMQKLVRDQNVLNEMEREMGFPHENAPEE